MPFRFAVSATFTAEPIEPMLGFWGRQLQSAFEVRFAPYNQVARTLADPAGEFARNQQGVNVVLLRLEDLAQFDSPGAVTAERIESNLREVARLVRESPQPVPLLFVLCPPSPAFLRDPARVQLAHEMALRAEALLEGTPGVVYTGYQQIARLYPVASPANPEGERLARIPYTDLYFAALGTTLVRLAHGLFVPPFKVIALDCDNTLWSGICGESGPRGVTVDPPRRRLQEFMREQHDAGMLLAMASKNNEADVLDTLAQHPEMPLQLHHFVSRRLNWEPKSVNLQSLASELSLGLDSFILVDDNPKECAEAAESMPEVLAVALPAEAEQIPHFLDHIWAFDHVLVTEEDRDRNAHYAKAVEFGRELKKASSAEDFFKTLDLRVQVQPVAPERLARVAQLTQRTNQFNFTTTRRTEAEIRSLLGDGMECLTVDVSDRFGDYGLTGVVLFRSSSEALEIDTLLLSCRVLGRGVEHRLLAHLGEEARRRGCKTVLASFRSTSKNEPARLFLDEIGVPFAQPGPDGFTYPLPSDTLLDLEWKPIAGESGHRPKAPARPTAVHKRLDYAWIARSLSTPGQILQAVRAESGVSAGNGSRAVPAMKDTEARLAAIWADLLRKPEVSVNDNFFDLGGHSLLAVLLIVRVREAFGVEVPIDDVYAANLTLAELAQKIDAYRLGDPAAYEALYKEIEGMSDEQVKQLLAKEDPGVSLP